MSVLRIEVDPSELSKLKRMVTKAIHKREPTPQELEDLKDAKLTGVVSEFLGDIMDQLVHKNQFLLKIEDLAQAVKDSRTQQDVPKTASSRKENTDLFRQAVQKQMAREAGI